MRIAQQRNHSKDLLKRASDCDNSKQQQKMIPICDARSPAEYAIGHIPGATNLPLFTNEERAKVGTLYKNKGRSNALCHGMSIVRPKLDALVSTAAAILENSKRSPTTNRTTH